MKCRLCNSELKDQKSDSQGRKYQICSSCELIQLDKSLWLSDEEEKNRYLLHENSTDNEGYIRYLNNIIQNSFSPYLKPGSRILDFGCGPEKTWVGLLEEKGYQVSTYDPYFDDQLDWMEENFDAISAIEVFEHIASPSESLNTLCSCLNPENFLIIRTMLHDSKWNNFSKWWYREDPTHISFYSKATIDFICLKWNLKLIQIIENCEIVLKKI